MGKLGYSSLTLTDITETIPISLALQSNLEQGVQTKNGTLYVPDFTEEELIIIPSLFLGSTKIDVPTEGEKGVIVYQISGETKDFSFSNTLSTDNIWVDDKGCLHYKKNLEGNTTIDAYILEYKNVAHDYTVESINAANPITILFLEQSDNDYSMLITSTNGREHFDENNADDIILTAHLYKGIVEVTEGITYEWDTASDTDDGSEKDFFTNTRSIVVPRSAVPNIEVFQCTITIIESGFSLSSQKILRDFTDGYTNQLIANGTLILTPKNPAVTLENQVWYQTKIINGETDQSRFSYGWKLLLSNGNEVDIENYSKTLIVNLEDATFSGIKENFSILGTVIIDGKAFTANYADIKYQPISYSVEVSPRQIFIPTNSEGKYQDDVYSTEVSFRLVDEEKQSLEYNRYSSFFNGTQVEKGKWDFLYEITLTKDDDFFSSSASSKNISIPYTYLGVDFIETIQLVKNYAGERSGQPTYNISLSNSYHRFAGGELTAIENQVATFNIFAYYGADSLEITKVSVGEYEITDLSSSFEGQSIGTDGLSLSYNAGEYSLITTNKLSSGGAIKIRVSVRNEHLAEKTFLILFEYDINFADNKSYSLFLNTDKITYSMTRFKFDFPQVIANAFFQTNGTGSREAYLDGYLTYSIDNGVESSPQNGSSVIFNTSNLNASNNFITFYLYRGSEKTKLLDKQSVPILYSYEGLKIGGENLLRWTKTLKTDWKRNENAILETEGDFSVITISPEKEGIIYSPKIVNDPTWDEYELVFSCSVKVEDATANMDFELCGFNEASSQEESVCFSIGNLQSSMEYDEEWKTNKWMRIYKVFNFSSIAATDLTDYPYIGVKFSGTGALSLKQPKLELGNIPTSWSASPYDVEYSDIVGTNLSAGYYVYEVRPSDPSIIFATGLEPSSYYTFSCERTEWTGDTGSLFLCQVNKEITNVNEETKITPVLDFTLENRSGRQEKTFFVPPDTTTIIDGETISYVFYIYAKETTSVEENTTDILSIYQAKLEKGTEATPFFMTDDYLSDLISALQEDTENNTEYITIVEANGNTVASSVEKLQENVNALQEKTVKIDENAAAISAINSEVILQGNELKQLTGYVQINASDAGNPYIEIATKTSDEYLATRINNNQLGFYYGNDETPVAYINKDILEINRAKFNRAFSIGDLNIVITESGVGFTW